MACRMLAMHVLLNTTLIEFEDGYRVVTSLCFVRLKSRIED